MFDFLKRVTRLIAPFLALVLLLLLILTLFTAVRDNRDSPEATTISIAALSALIAAISSVATLAQAREMRQQREIMERPFVVVYFELTSESMIEVVIENFGNTPAKNIRIGFNPAPIDSKNGNLNEVSLFKYPITLLAPRKSIRQKIHSSETILNRQALVYEIQLHYESITGYKYSHSISVDISYMEHQSIPQNRG